MLGVKKGGITTDAIDMKDKWVLCTFPGNKCENIYGMKISYRGKLIKIDFTN